MRHRRREPERDPYSWLVYEPQVLLQVMEGMNANPELVPSDRAVLLALMATVQPRTNSSTATVGELMKLAGLVDKGNVNGSLRRLQRHGLVVRTVIGEGSTMACLGWMLNPAVACCGGTSKPIQMRWDRFRRLLEAAPAAEGRTTMLSEADRKELGRAAGRRYRARLKAERLASAATDPVAAAA